MNDIPSLLKVAQVVLKRTFLPISSLEEGHSPLFEWTWILPKRKFRCIHLVEIDPVALKKKKCENFTDDQTDRETDRQTLLNNWQKVIRKAHSAKNYRIFLC